MIKRTYKIAAFTNAA